MSYQNCTELRKDFPYGVKVGHPAYASKHDRDDDGYACETPGREGEAAVRPVKESSTGTKVESGNGTGNQLPQTGPGEVGALGAAVLVVGMVVALIARRRRTRFVS